MGVSTKEKTTWHWGLILNLTTFTYASFHTVNSIANSAYSMLQEMKADNDPAGGPVMFFRVKCEKETDVKGNISQMNTE